jgi:hypothetical protein
MKVPSIDKKVQRLGAGACLRANLSGYGYRFGHQLTTIIDTPPPNDHTTTSVRGRGGLTLNDSNCPPPDKAKMIDSTAYNATDCRDGVFGPRVWTEGCRGGFDFTRAFPWSGGGLKSGWLVHMLTG